MGTRKLQAIGKINFGETLFVLIFKIGIVRNRAWMGMNKTLLFTCMQLFQGVQKAIEWVPLPA